MQLINMPEMESFPFPVLCHKISLEYSQGCAVLVHPGLIKAVAFCVFFILSCGGRIFEHKTVNEIISTHRMMCVVPQGFSSKKHSRSSENPVEALEKVAQV